MSENTSLVAFNQLPEIAAGAGEILTANKNLHDKALNRAQQLLDTIEAEGMTPELDAECNTFLGTCAQAKDKMNGRRSPITKLFTAIVGEFTSLENPFDKAKPGTFAYQIQEARNNYARAEAAKARAKEEELRKQRLVAEEKINIQARVETTVCEKYNGILFAFKKKYNDLFNSATLENIIEIGLQIDEIKTTYPRDKINNIEVPITSNYIQPVDLAPIIFDTKAGLYDELSKDFHDQMEALKQHLTEQIPARKFELEEIEKAGTAEKKRLKEQAELRQREEELRIERENLENEKKAAEAVNTAVQVNQAELTFEQDVAMAEIRSGSTAVHKAFYIINVKSNTGWMQIVNLWFREFGGKITLDKMPAKKLESMKKDLETLAFNGGEKLVDSVHLEYVEDVKAITKKQ